MNWKQQWKQLLEDYEQRLWEKHMREQWGEKNEPAWVHYTIMAGIILLAMLLVTGLLMFA